MGVMSLQQSIVVSIFNRVLYKLLDKQLGPHCSMRGLVFLRKPFAACDFPVCVGGGRGCRPLPPPQDPPRR